MQEIALLLSSLAGVATAAAVRKMPRNKPQLLSLGASSHIKSQINSLKIEKDLLAKTISRLYQNDAEYSKIQRDKLLLKYQHQMGIVMAKLEKLEQASKHPDLGPVGDGLITLMDQKLSKLDDRLYELSSKMAVAKAAQPKKHADAKKPDAVQETTKSPAKTAFDFERPDMQSSAKPRQSFELTTLTRLSSKEPQFPPLKKQPEPKEEMVSKPVRPRVADVQKRPKARTETVKAPPAKQESALPEKPDIAKEVAKFNKHRALPEPDVKSSTALLDDDFDDDSDDIDKIKGDIKKVLSRLDQAEVE